MNIALSPALLDKTSMSPDALIRFDRVSKRYDTRHGGVPALDDISLDVPRGGILGVIGRSGAGKSTLIRLVNGLERPSQGRVLFEEQDVARASAADLRALRRSIGMIFQHFNLLASRTAFGNVAFPLEIAGWTGDAIATRVATLLDLVGLSGKHDRYPAQLSGGEKQRVGIARALATEPKVLLCDEATSALDPETTRSILDLLAQVNRDLGVTILLITHEMSVIRTIARQVAVLDGGRLVEHGRVFDIVARPQHATTRSFFSGEPGRDLPPHMSVRLVPRPVAGGQTLVRVTVAGHDTGTAALSRLARALDADVDLLGGAVDTIGAETIGTVVIGLRSDERRIADALAILQREGADAEVIGHVA